MKMAQIADGCEVAIERVVGCLVPILLDSCITQLKAQGPSRTCNESKEEEEAEESQHPPNTPRVFGGLILFPFHIKSKYLDFWRISLRILVRYKSRPYQSRCRAKKKQLRKKETTSMFTSDIQAFV